MNRGENNHRINKNHPKVSIILPTYNRANLVGKSVESVLNQTYNDFELIIVDDGSTDNTKEVLKSFEDSRIQYIIHNRNKGAASAMNTGIKASKGHFLSIQNSDDIWLPEKIEKELKSFENSDSGVGVVYSGLYQVKKNKKIYLPASGVKKKEGFVHDELLNGNFVNGLSLIKKICFEKAGLYDENLPGLEDWELYIRISKYYTFKFVDKPLIVTKLSQDSLSVKPSVFINSTKMIIEKHYKEFNEHKTALAMNYGFLGSWSFLDGELEEGRSYFIKAIKLEPLYLQFYFAFLISFFGQKIYEKFLNLHQNIKY